MPGDFEELVEEKPTFAKAVTAGVTALSTNLITAIADGHITATEWITVVAGTIIAIGAVWAVTNKA